MKRKTLLGITACLCMCVWWGTAAYGGAWTWLSKKPSNSEHPVTVMRFLRQRVWPRGAKVVRTYSSLADPRLRPGGPIRDGLPKRVQTDIDQAAKKTSGI